MYVQLDMILLGSYSAFDKSSGMEFTSYALTDLEDGTARRMTILGTLLEESKYGDAAYASGATLDEEEYKALCDQWSGIERGERVTVRGKLTKAYFTDRYHLGNEDAQKYEVYMSVMELEPIVEKAVNANEIVFERIDDPNTLWTVCEMNYEAAGTTFGYAAETCYVELELEVSKVYESSKGELYIYFEPIVPSAEADGTERSIKLTGEIDQYSGEATMVYEKRRFGARVDETTYKH